MATQVRHSRYLLSFGIFGFLSTVIACQSGSQPVTGVCPEWAQSIPRDETHFYARGISGPTPRVADAWDQAIECAKEKR